jgi:hypothetical protein
VLPAAGLGVAAVALFTACAAPPSAPVGSPPAPVSGLDAPPPVTAAPRTPGGSGVPADDPQPTTPRRGTSPAPRGAARAASPTASGTATGPLSVDVFGDSIGWTLGCGIAQGGPYEYFGQRYPDRRTCDSWPSRWRQQVAADHPDEVLLVVGRWETMDRVFDGRWSHVGDPGYTAQLARWLGEAIDVLGSDGARVVVSDEPYNRRGEQPDGQLYPEDEPARVDAWNAVVRHVVADHPDARLLGLHHELCPDGAFTWDVDGVQVRSDGVHLTPDGVRWLTPWLIGQLRADRR